MTKSTKGNDSIPEASSPDIARFRKNNQVLAPKQPRLVCTELPDPSSHAPIAPQGLGPAQR
jgi:hypothetical protein